MWNPENWTTKDKNKDLLWIYWHVISLVYSINKWLFDNSTIWLTGEWWNGKTKIMNLTKNLINKKEEYKDKYFIIDINPWEYDENINFFDILLKSFFWGNKNTFKSFLEKNRDIISDIVFIISLFFLTIFFLELENEVYNIIIIIKKWILWLGLLGIITFFITNKDILKYLYDKTKIWFIFKYSGIWSEKERFEKLILEKEHEWKKIIFFIDDLDRCSEKQVVNILKTIVLFWNQKNSVFILWYDENIIIEKLKKELNLKDDISVKSYIEKIINLQIPIPKIDKNDVSNYIDWNINAQWDFNIINLDLPLKFLKMKELWIEEQFQNKEFKDDLFDLINSKTPRWINTWYRTVYYNFIYLIVLESYWYITFEPDINLLLKASILKQKFWDIFNKILLSQNSNNTIINIFDIIKQRDNLNNILLKLKKEKNKLEKEWLFKKYFSYNIVLKTLKEYYSDKVDDSHTLEKMSDSIYEETFKLKDLILKEKNPKLQKYHDLISNFEDDFWKYEWLKDSIDENYLNFIETNQKELIEIFSFNKSDISNFINYYYNPPKINNWLLVKFINLQNNWEKITYFKLKKLLIEYIRIEDDSNNESEKIMIFLCKNLVFKKDKNWPKVKIIFEELKKDKIFFWKFIQKLILDLDNYFKKNEWHFNLSENNKRKYNSFENIKLVISVISKLLKLENSEKINSTIFENNFMKNYFLIVIKLNLKHRIKEFIDIIILDKFNPWLFKYYLLLNASINNWKWNKYLNDSLQKNFDILNPKKQEIINFHIK